MRHSKNRILSFFLALILLTAYSIQLNATVRYVSKTGNSTPPYTTWETAADSIQKCINISVFGDTIYVANGVYQEQVVMIPGLSLIGAGADSCLIDTRQLVNSQTYPSVLVADSSLFTGFNILVYFNSDWGYGIEASGYSLVKFNRISKARRGIINSSNAIISFNTFNTTSVGIELSYSNAIVNNNIISTDPNTSAPLVAGIYIDGNTANFKPSIVFNYIEANSRATGIYKNYGTRSTIKNNVIKLIGGSDGIFLHSYVSDSAWVYNNLIFTELPAGYGIDNNGIPNLFVINNYLSGNFLQYALYLFPNNVAKNNVVTESTRGVGKFGSSNPIFQYNNLWNNEINYTNLTPDSTNLSVDPMIVNDYTTQGELDFHLQMFSPLIDSGDPNILDKDSTRSDIGLYGGPYGESYTYQDIAPKPPRGLFASIADSTISLSWERNAEADFGYYNLYRDTANNFSVDSTKLVASVIDTFFNHIIPAGIESLYFKITGVDNQGNESGPSEEVGILITGVEDDIKPLNNYILYQNYPNPFNPSTRIGYKLKERGYVKLYVYEIKGELVEVLVNKTQEAGYYEVEFSAKGGSASGGNASSLTSGVYIYQIFIKGENNIPVFSDIKKMVFMK